MNYIIVDDEYIAHEIIKGYCDKIPHLNLVTHCYDAFEALECLRKSDIDLIFLDLNMPKMQGFDFLKSLSNPPQVIVTTAHKDHALEGYELNIIDYLLKPISFDRFLKAINKIENKKQKQKRPAAIVSNTQSIFVRSNRNYVQLQLKKILYIESLRNYCKVVTIDDKHTVREKISHFVKVLPSHNFIQVHKSFMVASEHINKIEGLKITIRDYTIPIGKLYKFNVDKLLP